jgi:N4-gp56 family major capsid protein
LATGTTTTTAQLLKQYWHNFFLSNLDDWLAFKGLSKRAIVPKGSGKVVWWYGLSKVSPAGATLSEGSDPTARSSTARRVSGTLTEYGNLVKNSRLFSDVAIDGTKEAIMKDLARDAAKTLDDAVLAKALAGGTVLFAGAATHRSNVIKAHTATIKEIRKAVRLLEVSSVPRFPDGFYVGLIHPDVRICILLWETIIEKLRKFGEHLKSLFETIPSQAHQKLMGWCRDYRRRTLWGYEIVQTYG